MILLNLIILLVYNERFLLSIKLLSEININFLQHPNIAAYMDHKLNKFLLGI